MKKIISRFYNIYNKQEALNAIGLTLIAFLIIGGWFYSSLETLIIYPEYATAATTSAVTVSATVTATISCSTNQSSTSFGTLTTASVSTSTPNASSTISCVNSAAGCTLYIKDAGSGSNPGLWNSTSSALIASASSTLIAGTEGYGINATTTATGSGAVLTISAQYRLGSDASTSTIGGLLITNTTLASVNTTSSNRETVVRHKASISTATAGGTYDDTITYECTAN